MKRILITGVNSFIGDSLQKWLERYPNDYYVSSVDLKNEAWRQFDFCNYDVVFHVAGIAHVSSRAKDEDLYFKVNRDLAIETAEIAKKAGVRQFIFMSSIIVYGNHFNDSRMIDKDTVPYPDNDYGRSKLEAEKGISSLGSEDFRVVILRPPMIYGKGSKGNYPRLSKLARILPLFPDYDNKRSMLYIGNLCEFIRLVIEREEHGIFFPQNPEYVRTSTMVKLIAEANRRRIVMTKAFNPVISLFVHNNKTISKLFGNLTYEKSMSEYKVRYQLFCLKDSIEITENIR